MKNAIARDGEMAEEILDGSDVTMAAGDVDSALAAAPSFSPVALELGSHTAAYLKALRELGAFDLTSARVIEPHLDALAILHEAGIAPDDALPGGADAVWGVYAARAPQLRAEEVDGTWTLHGTKPWCSLGEKLTHALITAGTPQGQRLFAVRLDDERVTGAEEPWISRGLNAIKSTSLTFNDMPVTPIGEPGFYLNRSGFAWGGIGVAAVWAGGAQALADAVLAAANRREPDQIALMHCGRLDILTHTMNLALADAATAIDAGRAQGREGMMLAARVRAIVASAAEEILSLTGHALGPGPLAGNETHARRVADLTVYVRQHHAERDLAALGSQIVEGSE